MKRTIIVAHLAILLAIAAFYIGYRVATRPTRDLVEQGNELVWLSREFQLTPDQTARVARLHADYAPRCAETCRRIEENRTKLDGLIDANRERTVQVDELLRESADIQLECRSEMLAHIYAVAAAMSPAQGRRYVALMKPQVLQPGTAHEFSSRPHE
jgi:hypothetical protein